MSDPSLDLDLAVSPARARSRGRRWRPAKLAAMLGLAMACAMALPGAAFGQPDNVRILTYNAAFLYMEAENPSPVPPPDLGLTECTSCDPITMPPVSSSGTGFCQCWPSATLVPNLRRFADIDEVTRARRIAERILATDQDVVVLNEVFHPEARDELVNVLSGNGPYDYYVSRLRGHAPVEGLTLGDIIQMEAGDIHPLLDILLTDLPGFMDYHAVSGDSGLMIFSKYPFLELGGSDIPNDAGCGDEECEYTGRNGALPLLPGYFAFRVFDACEETDCWASKGVGLVKIDTPRMPSYVAFTHMQADYPADGLYHEATRAQQYDIIRKVITGAIDEREIEQAAVYLAGDLNTPGYPRTSPENGDTQEWHDVFDPASSNGNVADGFFACGNGVATGGVIQPCRFGSNGSRYMTDSWGFQTSTTDLGITNDEDGSRLDYILHSSMVGRLCMQHSMIAYDLQADPDGSGGVTWLSDHVPVRGDFGLAGPSCSANDDEDVPNPDHNVHLLTFGPTNCGGGPNPPCHQDEVVAPPDARITSAGSFQWFRIDQPGSFSIDVRPFVPGENVSYVVYHHEDLSRPIMPFSEKEGEWGIQYSMPDPPYYIRTFAVDTSGKPDRTALGRDYEIAVHQHLCRSPLDACTIEPGRALDAPTEYVWPITVGGNPGDISTELRELWWKFKTSGAKGGRLRAGKGGGVRIPTVQMQLESLGLEDLGCLTAEEPVIEVYDDAVYPSVLLDQLPFVDRSVDSDGDWEDDGLDDALWLAPDLPGMFDDELSVYFLKVTRRSSFLDMFNVCNEGMTLHLGYHTELTYFVPEKLEMWAELDDDIGAEDNLRIHMGFDASGFTSYPPASSSVDKNLEQPDSGSVARGLHGHAKLRGYYVGEVWPSLWEKDEEELIYPWSQSGGIDALSTWITNSDGWIQYSDGGNPDSADYYYVLSYTRCHLETDTGCAGG